VVTNYTTAEALTLIGYLNDEDELHGRIQSRYQKIKERSLPKH